MTILVTGAAGFIGSNFVLDWFEQNDGNSQTGQFDHDNDGIADNIDDDDDNDGIIDILES